MCDTGPSSNVSNQQEEVNEISGRGGRVVHNLSEFELYPVGCMYNAKLIFVSVSPGAIGAGPHNVLDNQ